MKSRASTILTLMEESPSHAMDPGTHAGMSTARASAATALVAHALGHASVGYAAGGVGAAIGAHVAARHAVKQFARNKYRLHRHIDTYMKERQHLKWQGASRKQLKQHYQEHVQKMVHHIAGKYTQGDRTKARRIAHRAFHGSYTGNRYI